MRPPEVIETERLLLRIPNLTDAPSIFNTYGRDAEMTRYLTWRPHENIRQTEHHVARYLVAWDEATQFPWVMVLKSEDKLIGMIELRVHHFKAELGYVLARPYWRQGLMTEAVRAVVAFAQSQPEIYRVWAYCDVDNFASMRVLEKVGMQHEGILRRHVIHPNASDQPRDCHCYSIVK